MFGGPLPVVRVISSNPMLPIEILGHLYPGYPCGSSIYTDRIRGPSMWIRVNPWFSQLQRKLFVNQQIWMVVSNIFYSHPYLGK